MRSITIFTGIGMAAVVAVPVLVVVVVVAQVIHLVQE
jgi:hypothetical protein